MNKIPPKENANVNMNKLRPSTKISSSSKMIPNMDKMYPKLWTISPTKSSGTLPKESTIQGLKHAPSRRLSPSSYANGEIPPKIKVILDAIEL